MALSIQSASARTGPKTRHYWMVIMVCGILPLALFILIASRLHTPTIVMADMAMMQWLHTVSSPLLTTIAVGITTLGDPVMLALVATAVAGYLFFKRDWYGAALLLGSTGGAVVTNVVLKHFFMRARPDMWPPLMHETGSSFPSAHAMVTVAVVLSTIILVWSTRFRWWAIGGGFVYILLVGLSRPYLVVHFPTDVVAGWCASVAVVVCVKIVVDALALTSPRTRTSSF